MNLELDILNIKDTQFGEKTTVSDSVLYIDRQELQELLAQDKRFSKVDIELAHPGESCRVVHVFDVIEPRARMEGTGENFPGILDGMKTVGEGRTRVLRGTAVVTIDYAISWARGVVIDMSGPGDDMGLYGKLQNIVLLCHPVDGLDRSGYQKALTVAAAKTSVYLAEASQGLKADEVEVYNLGSLAESCKGMEHLPRVAYIYQINYLQHRVVADVPIFYGNNVANLLPTIVHPNEVLDGAIVQGQGAWTLATYSVQNHPIIKELYRRHGKDLCFVGVVVTASYMTAPERERAAAMAAKLVKSVLGADGAILTKIGGGAPTVDLGWTCEACEELGVKTTVIVHDQSADGNSDGALLFSTPLANAIVNVGSFDMLIALPAMERVIGGPMIFPGNRPADGEINVLPYVLGGAVNVIGAARLMMREI